MWADAYGTKASLGRCQARKGTTSGLTPSTETMAT
eukprot:CAMPEP_0172532404 /NCGR_PEP_ID=MMETSP1067-20121228/5472_1 /TAXON_ID=265564 ORGANISM="Thalassiosira punctigera, Strain Tpunct2005C2" /NCGR_SAMPLE_ID=MMETSP1067 /ASSEMBLY_ACC=CAM_ASM_000444 /LENGTH=34 /DNA_ID= /DNA_START= /DNA_END= /DNA_ORIENTATION=